VPSGRVRSGLISSPDGRQPPRPCRYPLTTNSADHPAIGVDYSML
jgi:hypothetical protein